MQELHYYFAYGSNMNVIRARERKLRFNGVASARLDGFELKFNKRSRLHPVSGRANIVRRSGSVVHGVIYELCSPADIVVIDPYEHVPIDYRRIVVEAITKEVPVSCWTYVANPSVVDNSLRPTRTYLGHLLAGRKFLPGNYLKNLARVDCLD